MYKLKSDLKAKEKQHFKDDFSLSKDRAFRNPWNGNRWVDSFLRTLQLPIMTDKLRVYLEGQEIVNQSSAEGDPLRKRRDIPKKCEQTILFLTKWQVPDLRTFGAR